LRQSDDLDRHKRAWLKGRGVLVDTESMGMELAGVTPMTTTDAEGWAMGGSWKQLKVQFDEAQDKLWGITDLTGLLNSVVRGSLPPYDAQLSPDRKRVAQAQIQRWQDAVDQLESALLEEIEQDRTTDIERDAA